MGLRSHWRWTDPPGRCAPLSAWYPTYGVGRCEPTPAFDRRDPLQTRGPISRGFRTRRNLVKFHSFFGFGKIPFISGKSRNRWHKNSIWSVKWPAKVQDREVGENIIYWPIDVWFMGCPLFSQLVNGNWRIGLGWRPLSCWWRLPPECVDPI